MDKADIDVALEEYVRLKEQAAALAEKADAVLSVVNGLAGRDDMEKGSIWVEGERLKGKITRRVNTNYSDKAMLGELLVAHQSVLKSLFKIDIKESGQKVEVLIVSAQSPEEKAAVNALLKIRTTSIGKPTLEVVPNVG